MKMDIVRLGSQLKSHTKKVDTEVLHDIRKRVCRCWEEDYRVNMRSWTLVRVVDEKDIIKLRNKVYNMISDEEIVQTMKKYARKGDVVDALYSYA